MWPRGKHGTPEERFWAQVAFAPDGCWVWSGKDIDKKGYGRFAVGGSRRMRVARWAYQHFIGPVPEGHHVLHHCDNPPCCNPAHLFTGTQSDNMLDAYAKGRKQSPRQRLDRDAVTQIRLRRGEKHRDLAREFGVGRSTITDIMRGVTWQT